MERNKKWLDIAGESLLRNAITLLFSPLLVGSQKISNSWFWRWEKEKIQRQTWEQNRTNLKWDYYTTPYRRQKLIESSLINTILPRILSNRTSHQQSFTSPISEYVEKINPELQVAMYATLQAVNKLVPSIAMFKFIQTNPESIFFNKQILSSPVSNESPISYIEQNDALQAPILPYSQLEKINPNTIIDNDNLPIEHKFGIFHQGWVSRYIKPDPNKADTNGSYR